MGPTSLFSYFKKMPWGMGGAWVAQLVKQPSSAQVMISQFMNSSPAWGSVLTAQSPEPASDSVFPPLSTPPLLTLCVSVSLNNRHTLKKNLKKLPRVPS